MGGRKQVESPWLHDGRARGRHEAHCHLSLCKYRIFWDDGWYTFYKLPPLAIANLRCRLVMVSLRHTLGEQLYTNVPLVVYLGTCLGLAMDWMTSSSVNAFDRPL